ncbi:MAG: cytochrome c biogenesis CcdA family protein [Eubacteriales bacterium]
MENISFLIAFWGGIISFFSPCIIPIIPAYISYTAGANVNSYNNFRKINFTRTIGFVLGFSLVFITLGASATFLGGFLNRNLSLFRTISGLFIIFFGLYMLGLIKIGFLSRKHGFKTPKRKNNFLSSTLMGLAFGAGWTPCIGAVLGSILIFAGSQSTVGEGILLLSVYSLGLSIPFILTSLLLGFFTKYIGKIEKFSLYLNKIGGIILIILGILIIMNKLTIFNSLLL